jgi:hypothetical protein
LVPAGGEPGAQADPGAESRAEGQGAGYAPKCWARYAFPANTRMDANVVVEPWYIRVFGECGFSVKRVAVRVPGSCIDRVNMYASTWICTKEVAIEQEDVKAHLRKTSLVELKLEAPALRMD